MGKVTIEYESKYEVGDVCVFKKDDRLFLGIIEGYYVDHNCDNSFWYDIRVNDNMVYTYTNRGDISEWDIIGKLDGELKDECYKLLQTNLR